jgi:hypothetical protein
MSLRPSSALVCRASLVLAAAAVTLAYELPARAQATGTTAPKDDPKKVDGKKVDAKKDDAKKGDAKKGVTPAESAAPATEPPVEAKPDEEARRAVYLSVDVGFTRPDIGAIKDNLGFDKTAANGVLAGIGVGYRFKELRLGARFRDATTTEFSLWSVMGEVGVGLPLRPVSPIFMAHAGYMFDTGVQRAVIASKLPQGNVLTPFVDMSGLVVGGELMASYWVTKFLRVAPFLGFDLTFLHRAQVGTPQSLFPVPAATRNNALFGDSGSGVGYTLNLGLRGTADIGF